MKSTYNGNYNLLTGDPHCVATLVNDCSVGAPLRLGKEANVILYEGNAEEDEEADTDGLTDPEYVWYKVTQPIAAGGVWGTYGASFFRWHRRRGPCAGVNVGRCIHIHLGE